VTLTLPASASTGDTIWVEDAENSFGTYNCTISGSSNITGLTYSAASSVVLNAPGNDATLVYDGSVWRCKQVKQGHWKTTVASSTASVAFTGLPNDFYWWLSVQNLSGTVTDPSIVIGYGATPTYITAGYYGATGDSGANTVRNSISTTAAFISKNTGTIGSYGGHVFAQVTASTSGNLMFMVVGQYSLQAVGSGSFHWDNGIASGSTLTAIKFQANGAFTFSGTLRLEWNKNNV
jgi:hypothetical protein